MQADLLVLSFSLALLAYTTPSGRLRKSLFYAGAFAAFTWCFLTKFNSIIFLPGLLLFFLFEKAPWRKRVRLFLVAALFGFANYAAFVLAVQKPETGTFALTYDKSWVAMAKLQSVYNRFPYPQGIHTKRWLALSSVLPPRYDVASVGMFLKVDSVPATIRQPMRQKFGYLLRADERVLDETLRRNPLPKTFNMGVSSIPISYFIGLKESDQLGLRVFRESVIHAPRRFFGDIARQSVRAFWYATTELTFPSYRGVGLTGGADKLVPVGSNWVLMVSDPNSPLNYRANRPLIWRPGLRFFSFWERLALSRGKAVFLMAIGAVVALLHGWRYGWSLKSAVPIALAVLLLGFDVFSHVLLAFRWKEWRLAYPIASILLGITFGWTLREMVTGVGRTRATSPSTPTSPIPRADTLPPSAAGRALPTRGS